MSKIKNIKIVYLLNIYPGFGCLPECIAADLDKNANFSVKFTRIVESNMSNYEHIIDERDRKLIDACWKLSLNSIQKRSLYMNFKKIEDVIELLKQPSSAFNDVKLKHFCEYSLQLIAQYQNVFFENIGNKEVYLPTTKFPFGWTPLTLNVDMPELYYFAKLHPNGLDISLAMYINEQAIDITGAQLLTRKPARILLRNKIIEFDDLVQGEKLIPYFNKKAISVPQHKTKEYINKILLPMVRNDKLIADGITINQSSELKNIVLRVKEYGFIQQTSLFDDTNTTKNDALELIFELLFEYDDFVFSAGRESSLVKMDEDKTTGEIRISSVERNLSSERYYCQKLREIGFELEAKIMKLKFGAGIDLLNHNYKNIENLGIELRFERKTVDDNKYFVGERQMEVIMSEERDWFDLNATVRFGNFEIPFIKIIQAIKFDRDKIMLPNGEFAYIPQQWVDEFKMLFDLAKIENGKVIVAKHYAMLAKHLSDNKRLTFNAKSNMRKFIKGETIANIDLPITFNGQLRDYQLEGYRWMRTLDQLALGGCLADDMGLGKTIQTICLLQWLVEQNRKQHLIVVPTSLIFNWQDEFSKFAPALNIYVHTGQLRSRTLDEAQNADIILTSYAILRRDKAIFEKQIFDYFILDEAQSIKNPHSDITKLCFEIKANRFLTLTGTPLENSISDLWSQVHFFNRNMLGSLRNFEKKCKNDNNIQLYRTLLKPFLKRRLKMDVLNDLPEKQIVVQYCDMSEDQAQYYKTLRNTYINKFIESQSTSAQLNSITVLEGLLRMRQASNHPKLVDSNYEADSGKMHMVLQKLHEVLAQGSKALIFSSFVEHLKIYKQQLDLQNIPYAYLDGSTKDRQEQVQRFQTDDNISVFLLSLKSGGVGLNLTKADYVFLIDPWWNPAAEAQAYDRAHRIGQKSNVFVYKFISKQTVEEKILRLQNEKNQLFDALIASGDSAIKGMDVEKILALLD